MCFFLHRCDQYDDFNDLNISISFEIIEIRMLATQSNFVPFFFFSMFSISASTVSIIFLFEVLFAISLILCMWFHFANGFVSVWIICGCFLVKLFNTILVLLLAGKMHCRWYATCIHHKIAHEPRFWADITYQFTIPFITTATNRCTQNLLVFSFYFSHLY